MSDKKLFKSGEASEYLGIHPNTLRKWDKNGKLKPEIKSITGYRYYSIQQLDSILKEFQGEN